MPTKEPLTADQAFRAAIGIIHGEIRKNPTAQAVNFWYEKFLVAAVSTVAMVNPLLPVPIQLTEEDFISTARKVFRQILQLDEASKRPSN